MFIPIFIDVCPSLQSLPDLDIEFLQSLLDTAESGEMTQHTGEELTSMSDTVSDKHFDDDISRILCPVRSIACYPDSHIPLNGSNIISPQRTPHSVPLHTSQGAACYGHSIQTQAALPERRKRAASFSFGEEPQPATHFREASLVKASSSQTIRSQTHASQDNNSFQERVAQFQGSKVSSSSALQNHIPTPVVQKVKEERRKSYSQAALEASSCRAECSVHRHSSHSTEKGEEKKTEVSASGNSKPTGKLDS